MWIAVLMALAAYAATQQKAPQTKVAKKPGNKEPTLRQRTFTNNTGLGYVPDPVVQRPKLHAGNGLGSKAKQLEHQREVRDVIEIKSAMGF